MPTYKGKSDGSYSEFKAKEDKASFQKAGIDKKKAEGFDKGFGSNPLSDGILKAFKDLVGHNTVAKPKRRL